MTKVLYIVTFTAQCAIALVALVIGIVVSKSLGKCQHLDQADLVVDYTCTCETIETYCLDCGEKLAERTEC